MDTQSFAVHATQDDDSPIIAFLRHDRAPAWLQGILEGEGIYGAYRKAPGIVIVQTRDGEDIETELMISPDGRLFDLDEIDYDAYLERQDKINASK